MIMLCSKNQDMAPIILCILSQVIIEKPSTCLVEAKAKTYGRHVLIFCILHSLSMIMLWSKNQDMAPIILCILGQVIIEKPSTCLVEAKAKTYGRHVLIFCIL